MAAGCVLSGRVVMGGLGCHAVLPVALWTVSRCGPTSDTRVLRDALCSRLPI